MLTQNRKNKSSGENIKDKNLRPQRYWQKADLKFLSKEIYYHYFCSLI